MLNQSSSNHWNTALQRDDIDFSKPLVFMVSRSSFYEALIGFLLSIGMLVYIFKTSEFANWSDSALLTFIAMIIMYQGYLMVKYWRAGLAPIFQFHGSMMHVRDAYEPISLGEIIKFDSYIFKRRSILIFTLDLAQSDLIVNCQWLNNMDINDKGNTVDLRFHGRFKLRGKNLNPQEIVALIKEYLKAAD